MPRLEKNELRSPMGNNCQDPRSVAEGAATQAASDVLQAGGRSLKAGAAFMKEAVVENPTMLKLPCMIVGMSLVVISGISLFNVFRAVTSPVMYLVTITQMFFGLAILIVETPASKGEFYGLREKMFRNFGFLGSPIGRAILYVYISVFLFSVTYDETFWCIVQYIMGAVLVLAGVAQLIANVDACSCCCWWRRRNVAGNRGHVNLDERGAQA